MNRAKWIRGITTQRMELKSFLCWSWASSPSTRLLITHSTFNCLIIINAKFFFGLCLHLVSPAWLMNSKLTSNILMSVLLGPFLPFPYSFCPQIFVTVFLPNSSICKAGRNLRCVTCFGKGRSSINTEIASRLKTLWRTNIKRSFYFLSCLKLFHFTFRVKSRIL